MKKGILFLLLFHLFVANLLAQDCTSLGQSEYIFECDKDASLINIPIAYSPSGCLNNGLVFEQVPTWMTVIDNGNSITVNCQANETGLDRGSPTIFCKDAFTDFILGVIIVNQNACEGWYPDEDGDSFGNQYATPIFSCTQPTNYRYNLVANNLDACPEDFNTDNNGCEPGYIHEDMNWTMSKAYNINGVLKATSKSYFDELGKGIQSQTLDIETQRTWATETLYDAQGRPVLQTLSAPIDNYSGNFLYKSDFIKKIDGSIYTEADFENDPENPAKVGSNVNTLGHFYSQNNTNTNYEGNSYQDVTEYPFSRTIYSELNPGAALKALGGNKVDINNDGNSQWINGFSYSVPAAQEMYYVYGKNYFNGTTNGDQVITKFIKSVAIDVHGIETVVFTDGEGKTLAAARSGGDTKYEVVSVIGEQGYVDVHIPQGIESNDIQFLSGDTYTIYDLRTEQIVTAMTGGNFYRISLSPQADAKTYINGSGITTSPNAKGIRYKVNYYDYSVNYYDKSGKLLESVQPLGFDAINLSNQTFNTPNHTLKSTFTYNSLGQLLTSSSPDEGAAEFKYREDGSIRFSQNSKQQDPNDDGVFDDSEFSYTNYDDLGRPIESGVLISNGFETADPDDVLPSGTKKEQNTTLYDALEQTDLTFLSTLNTAYHQPTFLASNVAKTSKVNSTTYYSYDVYGRVKWLIQDISGLGVKTIDYKYDPITGNVLEVDYQKHEVLERFIHKYTYNIVDQLVQVETSTDGVNFTNQAQYSYYETGALKRTELADNLQGIDYIYNLAGQLKAINHPSGEITNDPGQDGANGFSQDVFSMTLDYYTGDYKRTSTPTSIASVTDGVNQYNGNIKAMTWKIKGSGTPDTQTYYYQYNKNNWLESAGFGTLVDGSGAAIDTIINSSIITTNGELLARQSITLLPGFHVTSGIEFIAKIDPNATGADNGDYNVSNLTYDKNGNILSLNRNKHTEEGSNEMDQLTYSYKPNKNQLDHVSDAVTSTTNADDIKTQSTGNYTYNQIGQLIKNEEEGIIYEYNASGLVTTIKKTSTAWPNGYKIVSFYYNDRGHRIQKRNWLDETDTYYIRDVAGNALAIYYEDGNNSIETLEYPIYGASRIGVHYKANNKDVYQLTDHLGNVRAVVERANPTPSSTTDYYPFGMPMPGRQTIGGELYRYAFQGQEKDPETGKEAFQLRLWDGRIGRWLSPDPFGQYFSPYLGMGNNPAIRVDPDGGSDCPNPPCNGETYLNRTNELDEVIVRGQTNNTSGYVPNARDWEILAMFKQDFPALYRSVNARYQSGDYYQLGGYNWGNFAAGWKRGGEDYHLDLKWNGISVTGEVAYPINLNFLNRNSNTPNYGYGITLGIFNKPGFDDGGSFITIKKANSPSIAAGLSVDFISIETKQKNLSFHQGISGQGEEISGNFIFGLSKGIDLPAVGGNRHVPTTIMTSISFGPGVDAGLSSWTTYTYVFKK